MVQNYKREKERALTENIQYDSQMKFHDKKFMEKKVIRQKNSSFLKNKYKYKDMKSRQFGKFKNGMLQLTSKDVKSLQHEK